MSDEVRLPFTGERFTPECVREIWYEHWHRYAFVRELAKGRRVLDAACGEGYGSALLAGRAKDVIGVDIDAATIAHAQVRYASVPRLRYQQADAARLPFDEKSFDLVVSFETLEHLDAQEALLAGFDHVLADDGILIISSPDKRTYSELAGFRNEFHVRELYREELLALLRRHFSCVRLYGQKLLFQSALWRLDSPVGSAQAWTASEDSMSESLEYAPLYYIAICSRRELPSELLPSLSLFGDSEESVYAHYNHEIRKNMGAGARIAELEAEVERLKAQARPNDAALQRRDWRWWRHKPSSE